ncbi:MAG: tRNA (adenosine(37)-N6)-threonylcarbamoyltransferase complex dimerization subunit type 1 TsaB [Sulfuricella sp.]|nr:tRNA (adenosine(37)-N6)-threonylcarbamoyltransferase complex dimerization subunit type 1 TsaB [Sulfuricella sp.]
MKILAFDTSTEYCSVALWADGAVTVREVHAGQRHSTLLLPMVEEVLGEAGTTLTALDGIAYGSGPGSFTGLRIGCGVAQGLALGVDLPVAGVCTLLALAQGSGAQRVIACLDARMGEVYHAAYQRDGQDWREVCEPGLYAPSAAPLPESGDWAGCGSGFAAYGDALKARYGAMLNSVLPDFYPCATNIAALAAPRFASGAGMDAALVAPLYIRNKVALKTSER